MQLVKTFGNWPVIEQLKILPYTGKSFTVILMISFSPLQNSLLFVQKNLVKHCTKSWKRKSLVLQCSFLWSFLNKKICWLEPLFTQTLFQYDSLWVFNYESWCVIHVVKTINPLLVQQSGWLQLRWQRSKWSYFRRYSQEIRKSRVDCPCQCISPPKGSGDPSLKHKLHIISNALFLFIVLIGKRNRTGDLLDQVVWVSYLSKRFLAEKSLLLGN